MVTELQVAETIVSACLGSTQHISMEDAVAVLEELGVPDAHERVEWRNITGLDADDILALANLEFSVDTCDMCGARIMKGRPQDWSQFQGVLQNEGGEVEINGKPKHICEQCLYSNSIFW
jgi:hypothetical protein